MITQKTAKTLSKTLLLRGAVLMVIGVGYEAINYPLGRLSWLSWAWLPKVLWLILSPWKTPPGRTLPAEEWAVGGSPQRPARPGEPVDGPSGGGNPNGGGLLQVPLSLGVSKT